MGEQRSFDTARRGFLLRVGRTLGLIAVTTLIVAAGCKDDKSGSGATTTPNGGGENKTIAAGDQIVVGEYGSVTGKEAQFGKSSDNGVQLATEELNAAGGINGKKVKIELEDDQSDSSKAETAVKRLIDSKNVIAVLGEVASGSSLAGGKVCQEAGVPMISPLSTKPSVTQIGDNIFRVCFIDPYQAAVVARFAHDPKGLNVSRVAIFTDKSAPYSVGFSEDFEKAFTKMGGQVVKKQSYSGGDKDFRGALTAIQSSNPQAILVPGYYSDAGSIANQARALGIKVPLLGGDGWDAQSLFDTGGDAVDGGHFSDHMSVDDPDPAVQKFVSDFQAKFNQKPDALAALAYDAARLLFDAMKRAKTLSKSDIKDAIAQTKDFAGVTGKITIDANRNASKPAVILKVDGKNRKFTFATRIVDPEQAMTEAMK